MPDLHIPRQAQTGFVFDEFGRLSLESLISEKAWCNWFLNNPPKLQPKSLAALDRYAQLCLGRMGRENALIADISANYLLEMVDGGLLRSMTGKTKSKNVPLTLISRAQNYVPISPMHLHLDAMDAAAWSDDFAGVPWSAVAIIAGERILQLLHMRWNPRTGTIYPEFRSDLTIKMDEANLEERVKIQESYTQVSPVLFAHLAKRGACPDWGKIGCESDIPETHVYKLLFALAADPEFLVRERLEAWTLDLATSALAMHALAWTDRYNTMSLGHPAELRYWAALHEIFFRKNPKEIDEYSIASAMSSWPAVWEERSAKAFAEARNGYTAILVDGGLSPAEILEVAMTAREQRPLVYKS